MHPRLTPESETNLFLRLGPVLAPVEPDAEGTARHPSSWLSSSRAADSVKQLLATTFTLSAMRGGPEALHPRLTQGRGRNLGHMPGHPLAVNAAVAAAGLGVHPGERLLGQHRPWSRLPPVVTTACSRRQMPDIAFTLSAKRKDARHLGNVPPRAERFQVRARSVTLRLLRLRSMATPPPSTS